jgi:hypothetical protein
MKLTADDYEPGWLERPYTYAGEKPYPPSSKDARAILTCLPMARGRPTDLDERAADFASTLREMDIDPITFVEQMDSGSTESLSLPTPGDSAADATVDAEYDYEYEYEYLTDVATIKLAAQPNTVLHEPLVAWRVEADAGVVAGTEGEFGSAHDDADGFVKLLNVGEAVHFGNDPECPIIAGARLEELPVPGRIARELNDRLSEMRVLTSPDADAELGSDPTVFPASIHDSVISDDLIQEPFAWDAERLIMWYDDAGPNWFDPTPYQFEDGMVVARSQDPQHLNRDLPDSREEFIEVDGLERISPDALTASESM